ncbi:unannotated protein [freshwater metagenome]|uniref:Unannotated protein n=1 Tax=freshwater metagenome TaxID=449393 RepID=A0A6J6RS33_9ZZZZ
MAVFEGVGPFGVATAATGTTAMPASAIAAEPTIFFVREVMMFS